MLISEAMVQLAPYGVERIDRIPNDSTITPVWKVRHHGDDLIYCCRLESLVWALTPSDDWEG
jgi:hypothetical protein